MNFLGLDVTGLDLERFLESGKAIYLCLYALWIALVFRGGRRMWVWGPPVLALVCWFVATFPLQQSYGLAAISDRMRNLWWCATVAAGQPIWESGVLDRMSLEPFWSLFVSLLSLRNPARVMTVYPFLPALAIVLVGCGLTVSALKILPDDAFEGQFPADRWRLALWCSFFVLLASTGPVDYLNPYRGFWAKTFMLKPNHALAFAVVPVSVAMLSRAMSWRRSIAVAVLLGLLGWAFIVYWALTCWGIVLYTAWTFAGTPSKRSEAVRIVGALAGGLLIVLPYVYFLIHQFPETVNFAPGVSADDPLRSVWGESPPRAQSLFFLSTFDLGANFYMALYGFWTSLFRGSRFDRLCVSLVAGAYSAWAVGGLLLLTGRGRQSDEIYYFLVFVVSNPGRRGYLSIPRTRQWGHCEARSAATRAIRATPKAHGGRARALASTHAGLVVESIDHGRSLPPGARAATSGRDRHRRLDYREHERDGCLPRRRGARPLDPGPIRSQDRLRA